MLDTNYLPENRIVKSLDDIAESIGSQKVTSGVYPLPSKIIADTLEGIAAKINADGGVYAKVPMHICGSDEYDVSGMPTIESPEDNTFYLVPTGEDSNDMFEEWVYVNGEWEKFGSGGSVEIPELDWNAESGQDGFIKNKPLIMKSTGVNATTIGINNTANGENAVAIGAYNYASGMNSVAMNVSKAMNILACSQNCAEAYGERSSAENEGEAYGYASHAEGCGYAYGRYSSACGDGTIASNARQFVFGKFNIPDTSNTQDTNSNGSYVEIVGNGTNQFMQSNARTLDWSGNEWLAGNMTAAGGTITIGSTAITEAQLQALLALLN